MALKRKPASTLAVVAATVASPRAWRALAGALAASDRGRVDPPPAGRGAATIVARVAGTVALAGGVTGPSVATITTTSGARPATSSAAVRVAPRAAGFCVALAVHVIVSG